MFDRFKKSIAHLDGIKINYVIGGEGPPLLLLHGYPQTHVMWHKIAAPLAEHFTVIASDLRGYGDSDKPPSDDQHTPYSKRASGNDQIQLMQSLGFTTFQLIGHDRGGRVGHRMALDHPEAINKLVVMDIAPTYTMYTTTDMEFATAYYHWFFLIQPHDIPERMIGQDPLFFLEKKLGQWGKDRSAFTQEAFHAYLRCWTPETIHASCEDYRASATIDIIHDQMDLDQGNKIKCPVLCLWGTNGFVGNKYDVVSEWSKWAGNVQGQGIHAGHYLPEEAPQETLQAIMPFLLT
ncbi:MAG: alpha/beta hydrolase [Saprospiraceae bacterium]|nr:alpha/beta hydrolase [Saprospiraceae bacterium]